MDDAQKGPEEKKYDVVEEIAKESEARRAELDRESELRIAQFKDEVEGPAQDRPSYLSRFVYLLLMELPVAAVSDFVEGASQAEDAFFFDEATMAAAEVIASRFDENEAEYEGWDETPE